MSENPRPLCRHCQRWLASRARGLCYNCSQRPEIRALYLSTSKFARRGLRDFNGLARLPDDPTPALPGTPERVAVLEERARRGLALWHPKDSRLDLH